ncbi:DUF1223 domain-containing protein [Roseobacter sp. HKCCA0434]|uniref:DUF1223 domain-containing protein n=1 Tax=Roseobacter sp. HKCCA0434 TaxID=3079297 RepID=UPI002905AC70|nr:DUF1223 domain-containing protein [Roseobacter sp. HKCCA0434]
MSLRSIALAAILLATPLTAQVGDRPVVVELFTSQGCSSCPPADDFLAELAERDNVIALSLHVDYWDYLGWQDPFASPAMTARQRAYAARQGTRSVFTPQMIVQGQLSAVGHRRPEVNAAIAAVADRAGATVELMRVEDHLEVRIAPLRPDLSGTVHVVSYDEPHVQDIARGENGGRRLTYTNVVTGWMTLGRWNGQDMRTTIPMPVMGRGVAVLVQDGEAGPILGAAKLEP